MRLARANLSVSPKPEANALHPRALAYIGDSVYELYVRELALAETSQTAQLHRFVTDRVNARFQVALLNRLQAELNPAEQEIVRRGRNVPVTTGRRSQQALHRQATGFEALIGYWYLEDPERLYSVLSALKSSILNHDKATLFSDHTDESSSEPSD